MSVLADLARDGRHARWDDHREQRRRHILDAAIEVVEAAPLGADLTLQDVADRAGLVRTVVQRHFGGRTGLLRAVQADVVEQAFSLISGPYDGIDTFEELVQHLVGATVAWVDEHPHLHVLIERELGDGQPSEISRKIAEYATFLSRIHQLISRSLGAELDERRLTETRLLYIGVIGQVRATVAQWVLHDRDTVSGDDLSRLLSGWVLHQLLAHAAADGLSIAPDTSLAGVLAGGATGSD
jgi:AcrR family transcriptional regulator